MAPLRKVGGISYVIASKEFYITGNVWPLVERVKGVTKTMIFTHWLADSSHSS